MPALNKCHNISDLRKRAKSKLPKPMFDYIDGGSDDEWSLHNNSSAFDNYELIPRYLRNVEHIDLSTEVAGCKLDLPFFLAPTGMSRLFHHDKEYATSKAASKFGTLYTLSTMATVSLEDVAEASSGPKMFQIYIHKDRGITEEFVARCKASGYKALCLTVDTPLAGNRERDLYNGMSMPPRFSLGSLWSFATHWEWAFNLLRSPDFKLANVVHRHDAIGGGTIGLMDYVNSQFDRTVTWKDAEWLVKLWDGPFLIKGLQNPEDAKVARDIGATGVVISNHGGRQLDTTPSSFDCIAPMRDAVGNNLELIVDGGVRRGNHIVKALAKGANACSIGRPYLYGLASGGQAGVERALGLLKSEVERNMALLGCSRVRDLDESYLQKR